MKGDNAMQSIPLLRAMVRGAYDLQQLRMQAGLRLCANFRARLGDIGDDDEDEGASETKKESVPWSPSNPRTHSVPKLASNPTSRAVPDASRNPQVPSVRFRHSRAERLRHNLTSNPPPFGRERFRERFVRCARRSQLSSPFAANASPEP
jgi:hypothetical protein